MLVTASGGSDSATHMPTLASPGDGMPPNASLPLRLQLPRRPDGQLLAEDLGIVADVDGKAGMDQEILDRPRQGIRGGQLTNLAQ